ncbi:hypothetical protein [Streptomyces albogriseolus]|uniref:hypothetical protein n=1 Tax=Streptomyces albogriseolus TaxID=1887 RepID=UPI002252CD80|nr:hypothetical protein [Streptomyces viridodiastaticus]MCX4564753.1 hypothetical protein [Streptomyces viridodiastaticus]
MSTPWQQQPRPTPVFARDEHASRPSPSEPVTSKFTDIDIAEPYGPWKTVYTRFRRYALDGVFSRALQQIQARADAAGDLDWLVQIDSTIVRAHQHAAATGRKGGFTGRTNRTITPSVDPEAD